jgi:hypothetical protein
LINIATEGDDGSSAGAAAGTRLQCRGKVLEAGCCTRTAGVTIVVMCDDCRPKTSWRAVVGSFVTRIAPRGFFKLFTQFNFFTWFYSKNLMTEYRFSPVIFIWYSPNFFYRVFSLDFLMCSSPPPTFLQVGYLGN